MKCTTRFISLSLSLFHFSLIDLFLKNLEKEEEEEKKRKRKQSVRSYVCLEAWQPASGQTFIAPKDLAWRQRKKKKKKQVEARLAFVLHNLNSRGWRDS